MAIKTNDAASFQADLVDAHVDAGEMRDILESDILSQLVTDLGELLNAEEDPSEEALATVAAVKRVLMRCGKNDTEALLALRNKVIPKMLVRQAAKRDTSDALRLIERLLGAYREWQSHCFGGAYCRVI